MNKPIKHILITRFNLPHEQWNKNREGKKLRENWLTKRYELFKTYCLPSVIAQTNKNFEWWLFFGEQTPEYYKGENKKLAVNFSNIKIFYEQSLNTFWSNIPQKVENSFLKSEFNILITSRLDNDDAISVNFIDDIQKKTEIKSHPYLLTFPIGYALRINKQVSLRKINYKKNAFISLVEFRDNQKKITVYNKAHDEWKYFDYNIINNNPTWLQVIHSDNLLNFDRGVLTLPFYLFKNFVFKKPNFSARFYIKALLSRFKVYRKIKKK